MSWFEQGGVLLDRHIFIVWTSFIYFIVEILHHFRGRILRCKFQISLDSLARFVDDQLAANLLSLHLTQSPIILLHLTSVNYFGQIILLPGPILIKVHESRLVICLIVTFNCRIWPFVEACLFKCIGLSIDSIFWKQSRAAQNLADIVGADHKHLRQIRNKELQFIFLDVSSWVIAADIVILILIIF